MKGSTCKTCYDLCRMRVELPLADPNICPPRQHAAPDEHAPLLSTALALAVEDDVTQVCLLPDLFRELVLERF